MFHLRDEPGYAFLHGGESGVQASSAARHVAGSQGKRFAVAYFAYGPYHATRYFPLFRGGCMAVSEGDGERCGIPEGFFVSLQECLYHKCFILFLSADSVNDPEGSPGLLSRHASRDGLPLWRQRFRHRARNVLRPSGCFRRSYSGFCLLLGLVPVRLVTSLHADETRPVFLPLFSCCFCIVS